MGIRGLTTFIQNRSHLYLEPYELHDTNLIIDGNAIACQLYKWHCKCNDCFGGDYDKFAKIITNFFQMLIECSITPYVVFDGGYETRKVATVISRMKNRIKSAEYLNSATEGTVSVFPLFLRETFLDTVFKLNIKCVRCDFESDTETASIARALNCPVLSYDSDFFIFNVTYIPFSSFEMCVRKRKIQNLKKSYSYISCKVYKVEKFLKSFGGMDVTNLPVLAVLLGNDYVKRSLFSLFFQQLKIQNSSSKQNEQQKRIKSLIIWLQKETPETAIKKVLSRYKCKKRQFIADKIQIALKGYNCVNSDYLKYLDIASPVLNDVQEICIDSLSDIDDESNEDEDLNENDFVSEEEETSDCELDLNVSCELRPDISLIFLENFRKCLYPPCFMDILLGNKYYCIPQVENPSLEFSHAISSEILSSIHKILTGSNDNLICIGRNEHGRVKKHILPHYDITVPIFAEVQCMDVHSRKDVLLNVLKIDKKFVENCLNLFPEKWQLFIITIKYLLDKSTLTWSFLYALLLCKFFLSYVDSHLGVNRSVKLFEQKFGMQIENILSNSRIETGFNDTIIGSLEDISYNDSLICAKTLMSYFHINLKMKSNIRLFDRNLVHSMAQFQSCFLHIKYLNSLLNLPYPNFTVSDFFNGTFVYNLVTNFIKRMHLDEYIRILLQNSPSILNSLMIIISKLKEHSNYSIKYQGIHKRRKKKKRPQRTRIEECIELSSEEESILDPNNKFSVLCVS